MEWIRLAQDRGEWHVLVRVRVCTLRNVFMNMAIIGLHRSRGIS
jgi:hypothetical protein